MIGGLEGKKNLPTTRWRCTSWQYFNLKSRWQRRSRAVYTGFHLHLWHTRGEGGSAEDDGDRHEGKRDDLQGRRLGGVLSIATVGRRGYSLESSFLQVLISFSLMYLETLSFVPQFLWCAHSLKLPRATCCSPLQPGNLWLREARGEGEEGVQRQEDQNRPNQTKCILIEPNNLRQAGLLPPLDFCQHARHRLWHSCPRSLCAPWRGGGMVCRICAHFDSGDGDGDGVDGAADDGLQVPGQHPLCDVPEGRPWHPKTTSAVHLEVESRNSDGGGGGSWRNSWGVTGTRFLSLAWTIWLWETSMTLLTLVNIYLHSLQCFLCIKYWRTQRIWKPISGSCPLHSFAG